MEPKKIFEIPFPLVAHNEEYFKETYEPFVAKYKDWIHDIYFTYTIDGVGDAMGGSDFSDNKYVIKKVLYLKDKYGVSICPTYNNIFQAPTEELSRAFERALDRFISWGVDIIQVPFVHWLMAYEYHNKYSNLKFKDTVLQRTDTAQDVWLKAKAGFDFINIDRNLLRNEDRLKEIKRAVDKFKIEYGKDIKIVILANELCRGKCELMDEHYMYNINNSSKSYFTDYISCKSCKEWFGGLNERLKITNIMPIKSEFDRLSQYVDVFKMHGRSDEPLWNDTMEIIENYVKGKDVFQLTNNPFQELLSDKSALNQFTQKVRNCKLECWECGYCEELADKILKK